MISQMSEARCCGDRARKDSYTSGEAVSNENNRLLDLQIFEYQLRLCVVVIGVFREREGEADAVA